MANPLSRVPFLGGYNAQNEANRALENNELAQAGAVLNLQGALARREQERQQQEQQRQARAELTALGPNPTMEQLAQYAGKYAGSNELLRVAVGHLDRQAAAETARANAQANLEQRRQAAEMLHEYRVSRLKTDQERAAELSRHNKVIEGLTAEMNDFRRQAQPKAPAGYRVKADDPTQLEPIPGGPKDTSLKDAAKIKGAIQKSDIVIGKVDEALKLVSPATTGLIGDIRGTMVGRVTGSGAYDLEKTIDTIKANLGFSELQAMREASPTGGALGQVAVQELTMLQSTVASLDKGQDHKILRRNLEQVRKHFENWRNAVQQAQQEAPAPAAGAWSIRPLP